MYEIGSTILYGSQGVCRIDKIEQKRIGNETASYYVLKPVYDDKATVYIPMQNKALLDKIRPILSKEEIDTLITDLPEQVTWLESENDRKVDYQKVLREANPTELLRIVRGLYRHEQEQKQRGRRLHQFDERAFHEAVRLIHDEFALALDIDQDDVVQYISDHIQTNKKEVV